MNNIRVSLMDETNEGMLKKASPEQKEIQQVYTGDGEGTPKGSTIARRNKDGALSVGNPEKDFHATTKHYVDERSLSEYEKALLVNGAWIAVDGVSNAGTVSGGLNSNTLYRYGTTDAIDSFSISLVSRNNPDTDMWAIMFTGSNAGVSFSLDEGSVTWVGGEPAWADFNYLVMFMHGESGVLGFAKKLESDGSDLYRHSLTKIDTTNKVTVTSTIYTNFGTPFDEATLSEWLTNNGYNSTDNLYSANGFTVAGGDRYSVIGLYNSSGTASFASIIQSGISLSTSPFTDFTDHVTQM